MERYFEDNRANWNDRVPIHAGPDGYGVDAFVAEPERLSSVVEFDRRYLGDVRGKRLLHTQCHIGTDTLSWAKLGATVTGVDFSAPALDVARRMADTLGIDARFIESDLYSSPSVLDERFDIVYTGVGALNWLPDITRWAEVMATFTRPGGTFYIREAHPIAWALEWDRDDDLLVVSERYFEHPDPFTWDEDSTYLGTGTLAHTTTHEWNHGLGEIITAILAAGFRIDRFEEHRFLDWEGPGRMTEEHGKWVLSEHQRDRVPLMYSLMATRVDSVSAQGVS
jgi:SAM-dependent methyltransferase